MLELKHIFKDYYIDKEPFHALKDISLFFPRSQFCCILGPSGCGKTTTLNIIGGLDRYTSGDLIIEGISTKTYSDKDWDNYRNKRIGFVFQNYNLVPHVSILTNVELAMTIQGISKKERTIRAKEALNKVGLKDIYRKKPNQLSGGQMQRVAIARALVNNPEIILADEPTGALDSVTSLQILDILKEVSKEKLVIMVTHNESLAEKYADRIITFQDGVIESDSVDSEIYKKEEEIIKNERIAKLQLIDEKDKSSKNKKDKKSRSKMGFWTAFKLAATNINSKKGRTILTTIGSSFGIIGVALVLALNNGFTSYINRLESETASTLPITLSAYTVTYSSTQSTNYNQTTKFPENDEIYPYIPTRTTTNAEYRYNNFTSKYLAFLEYLRDESDLINDYIINYYSGYSYHLLTEFPDSIDGETSKYIGEVSTSSTTPTSTSSLISSVTGLPYTVFHTLYGQEEYITENYDVIMGRYPTSSNELVLVVDQYNRISFNTLRYLGFYSGNDTSQDVTDKIDHEAETENTQKKVGGISWEEISSKKYKVFTQDEYYNKKDLVVNNQNKGNLYYPKDTTKLFNDDSVGKELSIVGVLRPSENVTLSIMPEGLCFLPSFQTEMVEKTKETDLYQNATSNVTLKEGMSSNDFLDELVSTIRGGSISTSTLNTLFDSYYDCYYLTGTKTSATRVGISSFISRSRTYGLELVPERLKATVLANTEESRNYFIYYILSNIMLEIDEQARTEALIGLYAYLNNYSDITNIIIFPKNLTSKADLLALLDEFNDVSLSTGPDDIMHAYDTTEQVYYTDIVGSVSDMMGELINIISVVLIVFASISLVVSCVMTGIITYASVIERTKEIGILRAIGARKKDVGTLFQSESALVGVFAGLFGCLVAFVIEWPLNGIINSMYPEYNVGMIANLQIFNVVILVIISTILTLISGFIPAWIAGKKDPVVCLRSE